MNRRILLSLSLVFASTLASEAVYAAPAQVHTPVYAMFAKEKMVKFSLRNDSAAPITFKVGDETMTVDAGKTKALELPVGTRILRADGSTTQNPSALVAQVSKELSGVTIAIRQ